MTDTPLLRLNKLTLKNYRCFEEFAIEFHPELTVLVAENGRGKTAVLDAIGTALGSFVDFITETTGNGKLNHQDIRSIKGTMDEMVPSLPTKVAAEVYIAGKIYQWGVNRKSDSPNSRIVTKPILHKTPLEQLRNNANGNIEGKSPQLLPFVAAYNTQRFWSDQEEKSAYDRKQEARLYGYSGCLSSSSSLKSLVDWYETKMREVHDPSYGHAGTLEYHLPLIEAVNKAIEGTLEPTKWEELGWDSNRKCLVVNHPDQGGLPIWTLSDGVRIMIALVMDITRRCITLNPHLKGKSVLQTPGILLIDEIDLHLHPSWQQRVLSDLMHTFPGIQFIVTTHSPQVISTVPSESIRIIKDGVVHAATPGTDGAESQRILEEIFQVSPRPQQTPMAQALDQYLRLVDARQWDSPQARELRHKLDDWSRGHEPRLLEADLEIENMKWEEAGQ